MFDQLFFAKHFSKVGLRLRYHYISMKSDSILKTVYNTKYGHFKVVFLSFGLTKAPVIFMDSINKAFAAQLDICLVTVYLENALLYSKTVEEHRQHKKTVFLKVKLREVV